MKVSRGRPPADPPGPRIAIARYDANPTLLLHAVDALFALFPDDNTFQLARLNVLRDLGRKDERTEATRRQLGRPDADPCSPTTTLRPS